MVVGGFMGMKWLWEQMRKKNPLIKRNAWVFAHGEYWRIANVDSNGHVVLRKEIRVHAADIQEKFIDDRRIMQHAD
jgi:hypothetical protein